MDGEWYAYLEEFVLRGFSQWGRINMPTGGDTTSHGLRVCLPDLIKPSKDFVMTATGMHPDDTLATVSKSIEPNTKAFKAFDATVTVSIAGDVVVSFVHLGIGKPSPLSDEDQIELYNCDFTGGTPVQNDTINNYINRFDISIDTVVDGDSFDFNPIGPAGANQTANGAGDLVGAYPAGHPLLANQPVKVLIPVRNGVTVNSDPALPADITVNDNPHEPVYALRQGNTSVGHAINPGSLFSGQLKVVLKGEDHKPIQNAYTEDTGSLTNIYGYETDYDATIVFVHKKKSMHY